VAEGVWCPQEGWGWQYEAWMVPSLWPPRGKSPGNLVCRSSGNVYLLDTLSGPPSRAQVQAHQEHHHQQPTMEPSFTSSGIGHQPRHFAKSMNSLSCLGAVWRQPFPSPPLRPPQGKRAAI
jgi:hypothetical protein